MSQTVRLIDYIIFLATFPKQSFHVFFFVIARSFDTSNLQYKSQSNIFLKICIKDPQIQEWIFKFPSVFDRFFSSAGAIALFNYKRCLKKMWIMLGSFTSKNCEKQWIKLRFCTVNVMWKKNKKIKIHLHSTFYMERKRILRVYNLSNWFILYNNFQFLDKMLQKQN